MRALTDAQLRKIRPPVRGLTEITDASCRGLVFRVTAAGISSFSFRFRDRATGRSERLSLGRYPGVSLRDARRKADALRGEIDAGRFSRNMLFARYMPLFFCSCFAS